MSALDDSQVMFPEVSQNHYTFSVPGEHYRISCASRDLDNL